MITSDCVEDERIIIDGINWIRGWGLATLRFALSYQPSNEDLFIVASPRCGTTWMQNLIYNLRTNGKPFNENIQDFFQQNPQLETDGKRGIKQMKRPGTIKTHLAIDRLQFNEQSKYICIVRNPIDVCVSFYFLYQMWFDVPKFDFNEFVEHFLNESLPFSGYFQCLSAAWNCRDRSNVLLISYEQLTNQFDSSIRTIAQFLNIDIDEQLIDKVKRYSSFEYLKQHFDRERTEYERLFIENIQDQTIRQRRQIIFQQEKHLKTIRNGKVNQSKSLMSEEQIERICHKLSMTCPQVKSLFS